MNRTELPAQSLTSVPPPVTGELDFRSLFSTHFAYVFHTLRRLGIPPRDLPDVTHDVFLQVYRRRDQFDPARPPRAWLFGFAFRVASRYRRLSYNRREQLDALPELPDPAPSVVEKLVHEQELELALAALDSLELTRRAVFILHELDGCPIPEVARTVGIPLNTAYSRLRLAREDFKKAARRLSLRRGEP
ncbi:MAG TPA: sigma-70 family RNA polymerase sigma factor [Polyangiaceae bacterium]|nr:sigma-70 family RNA polymerase sigma factor [Polyangiaceae bacterium]